jgi:branched-subunit amino acid aminotransferase/4-amino-4-deoxychorismate lyase
MYLINGAEVSKNNFNTPVENLSFWRGDGIFEAIRIHDGFLFALDRHLKRFESSAQKMLFNNVDFNSIKKDLKKVASNFTEGYVRVIISRSKTIEKYDVYMFHQEPIEIPEHYSLETQPSPWHPGGDFSLDENQIIGTKSTSYALNITQTRLAEQNGFTDALLINRKNIVLEGPTFSLGWIKGETVYVPDLKLGILDSITRQYINLFGTMNQLKVEQSRITVDEIYEMDTVFVLSTAKHGKFVNKINEKIFELSPVLNLIQECFIKAIEAEKLSSA